MPFEADSQIAWGQDLCVCRSSGAGALPMGGKPVSGWAGVGVAPPHAPPSPSLASPSSR